jgi:DNA-binding LytR/AlgR family response regulator
MNVLIIEDETLTARRLEKLLHAYDPAIQVLAQLPSVKTAVRWLVDHESTNSPDLIFLDIHLEDDTGFRIIELTGTRVPIIFTTAYDDYTLQAFKTNSIDYLLKPIDENELAAAINKFKTLRKKTIPDLSNLVQLLEKSGEKRYKDRFMITIGTKIRTVSVTEIAYFFFEDKATWLTHHEGQHLTIEYSLDKLEELLQPQQFFRVNRAFLVSLASIETIHTYSGSKLKLELQPKSRQEVYVSGDRITDFKKWLGK